MEPAPAKKWAAWLVMTAIAVAIAYVWLDRPISTFSYNDLHPSSAFVWFVRLTHIPDFIWLAATIIVAVAGIYALAARPLPRPLVVGLLASLSVVSAAALKDQLKFIFGRTWPETFIQGNPSFIGDGSFGFNFFHSGAGFASFPSGHTTVTCAAVSVLWICYPRLRALCALVVVAIVVGLLGADYHFLSDTIAGGFLGWSAGWIAVMLWERAGVPRIVAGREFPADATRKTPPAPAQR